MAGQYNPYAAGKKTYGGGRPMPTIGPVDPMGYKDRDAAKARQSVIDRNTVLRRLKNNQKGNYFPTDSQKGV